MAHDYIQNQHLCLSMHMSTFKSIYLENDKRVDNKYTCSVKVFWLASFKS